MAEEARDDEREALIAEANRVCAPGIDRTGVGYEVGLIRRLADALARKHPEPEWEYGVGWRYQSIIAGFQTESAEAAEAHVASSPDGDGVKLFVVRRLPERPAGPWVPVGEGEQSNG